MDIIQIQYFLCVAQRGSFNEAAEELYVSQSSVSKRIIALEKELGCRLFDRSKRKISLTAAGEAFQTHAMILEKAVQAMLADLAGYKTGRRLSIAAIPVIAQYGITSHIAQFRRRYADIDLILDELEAAAILPAVDKQQYDLAFVRDNYLDRERYGWLEVARDRFLVTVSRNHRYAGRTSVSLAELANEDFIAFDKGTGVRELMVEACHKAGFDPRVVYASLRIESILGMVASNSGIALMMERIFNYSKHPEVLAIPLDADIESQIVVAWPKDRKLPRPAEAFLDFLRKNTPPIRTAGSGAR
jgi:LysR family transcriptional regulator, transcription activator of glutamate synthase operon